MQIQGSLHLAEQKKHSQNRINSILRKHTLEGSINSFKRFVATGSKEDLAILGRTFSVKLKVTNQVCLEPGCEGPSLKQGFEFERSNLHYYQ